MLHVLPLTSVERRMSPMRKRFASAIMTVGLAICRGGLALCRISNRIHPRAGKATDR